MTTCGSQVNYSVTSVSGYGVTRDEDEVHVLALQLNRCFIILDFFYLN